MAAADLDGRLLPQPCSVQDRFALMMHDRIVELEGDVKALKQRAPDPRMNLLGSAKVAESGGVFLRLRAPRRLDSHEWASQLLRALRPGDDRYDVWCCHHWSIGPQPFVAECLVQRSGPLDVMVVAHAALDACGAECPETRVDACAVANPGWFAESIRTAAAALHTWDPVACKAVVVQPPEPEEVRTPGESMAWTLLHGWLACHTERADLWHPRALSAPKMATDLVAALGRLFEHV